MGKALPSLPAGVKNLLKEIKARVQHAQARAILAVNAELVRLYWDIGRLIDRRQRKEGWGAGVIPRLARALRRDLPEARGFSERNLDRMISFYRTYPSPADFSPLPMAKLPPPPNAPQAAESIAPSISPPAVAKLKAKPIRADGEAERSAEDIWLVPWTHHVLLMEKIKDREARFWYMRQTLAQGWSRNVLWTMIQTQAHRRQGRAISNFDRLLPAAQSDLVQQALKDPYCFGFLTLEEPFHERELEAHLLSQLERFLLELGQGFAFVGRQFPLDVGGADYFVDLLFYHLKLRRDLVIYLEAGEFKPEHAGKMNFYLNVIDDQLRHPADEPSIGLILCQERNRVIAEYALRGASKPIGVSAYELTRALPPSLRSALPTVEEIEAQLGEPSAASASPPRRRKPRAAKKKPKGRRLRPAK